MVQYFGTVQISTAKKLVIVSALKNTDSSTTYKESINIAKSIFEIVEPIFVSLSSDDLFKKCLHVQTQNPNESFNNIILTKCPKAVYDSRAVLEMGVTSVVLEFNEGSHGIKGVYSHFGFPGEDNIKKMWY